MKILVLCQRTSAAAQLHQNLRQKFNVDFVFTTSEFWQQFDLYDYDLLLVDTCRASFDCQAVVAAMRQIKPALPVILWSKNQDDRALQELLDLQVSAVFWRVDLFSRSASTHNIRLGGLHFNLANHHFLVQDRIVDLPKRESLLLAQLFINHRQFLSKNQIAKYLLRDCYSVNSNMVDVYIYRLRKILQELSPDLQIKRHHYLGYKITACN